MNSNPSSSLPLFHFPLITNPVTSHIHFLTPCSEIDYSKDNSVLKKMKVAMSCVDCSEVLLVFIIVDCCFHLAVTMSFPPHYIIFFLNTTPSHILEPFFTPCSLINGETICMDWIA
jgi:hypothetical protein